MTTEKRMSPWMPTTDPRELRRLGKFMEELGELQAVVGRCLIQGIDEIDPSSGKTNRQRLIDEIGDVSAQTALTIALYGLPIEAINARSEKKKAQMVDWESWFNQPDKMTDTSCSVCGAPQFETHAGVTCCNGHGGAPAA